MPLNPTDLQNWMEDPEEWVNLEDKENDQWEFEIRVRLSCSIPLLTFLRCLYYQPCSERVLMQLSNQYSQYVTPLLESTFKQVVGGFVSDNSLIQPLIQ